MFNILAKKILGMLFILGLAYPVSAYSEGQTGHQIVIVVDSSGSMGSGDPKSYSIQVAKIINDISSVDDDLTLVTFQSGCTSNNESANFSGGAGRSKGFDSHIHSGSGGTQFSVPIDNSVKLFEKKKYIKKMLLIVSDVPSASIIDSSCEKVTRKNLDKLNKSNVDLKYIYISKGNDSNPLSNFSQVETVSESYDLVRAVSSIYQNFIAKGIPSQVGKVTNSAVDININNYVKNAYLVILSEGDVGTVSVKGTPSQVKDSKNVSLNFKGGKTKGADGKEREYKVIRLTRPVEGKWSFSFKKLPPGAAWMVIQEYSVGIEFVTKTVAEGVPVTITAKLIDEVTKKPLPIDADMQLSMANPSGGRDIHFTNKGDVFVAKFTPTLPQGTPSGEVTLSYLTKLTSTTKNINKKQMIPVKVEKGAWVINPQVPQTATIGTKINLDISLSSKGDPQLLEAPKNIKVKLRSGETLELKSMGSLKYRVEWVPKSLGKVTMLFSAQGGNKAIDANAEVEVVGDAEFGKPIAIDFGEMESTTPPSNRELDLSNATIVGRLAIQIDAPYSKKNSSFEINQNGEWLPISDQHELVLQEGGRNKWPVRLVVNECPEGVLPTEKFIVRAWFRKHDGTVVDTQIPVTMDIKKDPWLVCWWPYLLGAFLTALLLKMIHCYITSARFPATFELLLAPDSDLKEEGMIYKILGYKGTKSGLCRDAQICMTLDVRFVKSPKGAFVKFQARNNGVYIIALGNGTLWSQRFGMDWEQVKPNEEVLLNAGTVFRDDSESIFFQARNI